MPRLRLVPVEFKICRTTACLEGSTLCGREDIVSWRALVDFLWSGKGQTTPSPESHLWALLPSDVQGDIMNHRAGAVPNELQDKLLQALNDMMKRGDFYQPACFPLASPAQAREISDARRFWLKKERPEKLHRFLVQIFLPTAIKKKGPKHYESEKCPECGDPFDPKEMRKVLRDRIIVVGTTSPFYEPMERCQCPECRKIGEETLYDLSDEDYALKFKCSKCGDPLFLEETMRGWLQPRKKKTDAGDKIETGLRESKRSTLLQLARGLETRRRTLGKCPMCAEPIEIVPWCPRCAQKHKVKPSAGTPNSCLPNSPTVAWVRTGATTDQPEPPEDWTPTEDWTSTGDWPPTDGDNAE